MGRTRLPRGLAALVICLVGSACAGRSLQPAEAARSDLEVRQQAMFEALGGGFQGIGDFYAEDAVLHVADRDPLPGRESIARFYAGMARFLRSSVYRIERMDVASGGDVAWVSGGVVNTFAGSDGPQEFPGKFMMVWQRTEGTWRVVSHSISSNDAGR